MKKILVLCVILVVGLTSCLRDIETGPTKRAKGKNDVTFSFTLPSTTKITRGVAAEAGENNVNDLTLLFFEPTTNGSGKFKGYYKVASTDLPDGTEDTFDVNVAFDSSSGLNKAESFSILAIANMLGGTLFLDEGELNAFMSDIEGKTETEVAQITIMNINGIGYDTGDNPQKLYSVNLPMSARGNKEEHMDEVKLKLIRAVVRFDVENEATNYKLKTVSVWNVASTSAIFNNVNVDYSIPHTKRFYGVETGTNVVKGGLYAVENVSSSPEQNDGRTTCLIIGLENLSDQQIHYYRLNINPKESGQYLRRNNVYQVTIKAVKGDGEASERDAYEDAEFLLDVDINSWDRDEDGLIIRDGDNLLALPTRKATFTPEAEERQYYIYTLGIGTLSMSILELPEGITARLEGNNLFITVTEFHSSERKGAIELHFAGMIGVIEILQTGKSAKYLTLNYNHLPTYPAGIITSMVPQDNPIRVSSSGPWTATVIAGDSFTFTQNADNFTYTGVNGTMITNIYNRRVNTSENAVTNVILFRLDEDPEGYCQVIVLTQSGTGNFTLVPDNSTANFNADGTPVVGGGNTNSFEVIPSGAGSSWKVKLTGTNSDKFLLKSTANTAGSDLLEFDSGSADRNFTIVPVGSNYSTGQYQATVEVRYNESKSKHITVTQANYTFTVSPLTVTAIPAGGVYKFNVTTNMSNSKFTASIGSCTFSSVQPYITSNKTSNITGQATGNNVLSITVPPVLDHNINTNPETTITVTIDGTTLQKTIKITQTKINYPTSLNMQTFANTYGRWNVEGGKFYQWPTYLTNSSLFGPSSSATVWTPSVIGGQGIINTTVAANARILCFNSGGSGFASFANARRDNDNVVMVITEWNTTTSIFANSGISGYTYIRKDNQDQRQINNAPDWVKTTKLWNYLVGGDGPFGAVNAANVKLSPADNNCGSVSGWPGSFIPLILNPGDTRYVLVGVDPTNRMIWVGDSELFHNYNNNYADPNSDNAKFLKNLLAYVVNVSLYGDAFNNQFKINN